MIPEEAVEAAKNENRSAYVAIVFYAFTVGFGLAGFVLAAFGKTLDGTMFGAGAFACAVLALLAARASIRWRKLKEEFQ